MDLNARLAKRMEATEKIATEYERNHVRDAALAAGGVGAIGAGAMLNHKPVNKARVNARRALRVIGAGSIATGAMGASVATYGRQKAIELGAGYIAPAFTAARNRSLGSIGIGVAELAAAHKLNTTPINKKRLAAKLGLITGGAAAAAAGAHGLMSEKKASKEDKKNPPSGWNRLARGLLGHIALPAIGATSVLAGAGLGVAADNVRNPYLKGALYGTGSLLALGGAATAGPGPLINDSYQAYRYIQEH